MEKVYKERESIWLKEWGNCSDVVLGKSPRRVQCWCIVCGSVNWLLVQENIIIKKCVCYSRWLPRRSCKLLEIQVGSHGVRCSHTEENHSQQMGCFSLQVRVLYAWKKNICLTLISCSSYSVTSVLSPRKSQVNLLHNSMCGCRALQCLLNNIWPLWCG